MPVALSDFKLPETDVRLIRFGDAVYKIKLRYRETRIPQETTQIAANFWKNPQIQSDLEKVIRYVLYNKEREGLEPMRTDDLVVYPYKKDWVNAHNLKFFKDETRLKTSPQLFLLYIERLIPEVSEKCTPGSSQQRGEAMGEEEVEGGLAGTPSTAFGTPYGSVHDPSPPTKKKKLDEDDDDDDENDVTETPEKSIGGFESSDDEENDDGVVKNIFRLLMTPAKVMRKIWS